MKRIDLQLGRILQRSTALLILIAVFFGYAGVTFVILIHLYLGFKEIAADYIHHEVSRHLLEVLLGLLILIAIKYAFVGFWPFFGV
jgi:hypothetical protein